MHPINEAFVHIKLAVTVLVVLGALLLAHQVFFSPKVLASQALDYARVLANLRWYVRKKQIFMSTSVILTLVSEGQEGEVVQLRFSSKHPDIHQICRLGALDVIYFEVQETKAIGCSLEEPSSYLRINRRV